MMYFVNNPELCKQMGNVSAKKIDGHTPEQWAEDFEAIVYSMLRE